MATGPLGYCRHPLSPLQEQCLEVSTGGNSALSAAESSKMRQGPVCGQSRWLGWVPGSCLVAQVHENKTSRIAGNTHQQQREALFPPARPCPCWEGSARVGPELRCFIRLRAGCFFQSVAVLQSDGDIQSKNCPRNFQSLQRNSSLLTQE